MSVISYKCPNCDGELIFDPKTQKYKCEYCFSLLSQEELEAMTPAEGVEQKADNTGEEQSANDQNTDAGKAGAQEAEGVIYTCPSCGAEIVTDATTAATFCYYCHNPVVLGGRLSGEYLPDKVIPFSIEKKEAQKQFYDYLSKKKFIPKAFFNKKQMEHLSGVYFPYWIYDISLRGKLKAKGTKTRIWRDHDTEFTETKFYEIEREGKMEFKDMTENALKKANRILAEGILPYRMEESKPFHMGFLSGFLAEKRDIAKSEVEETFRNEAKEYATNMLRESVSGYETVTDQKNSFSNRKETFSYTLLPVWTLTYPGKDGKTYYYSMNAQTGKVCGKLPIDYRKLRFTAFGTAAVILLVGLLGGYFIW